MEIWQRQTCHPVLFKVFKHIVYQNVTKCFDSPGLHHDATSCNSTDSLMWPVSLILAHHDHQSSLHWWTATIDDTYHLPQHRGILYIFKKTPTNPTPFLTLYVQIPFLKKIIHSPESNGKCWFPLGIWIGVIMVSHQWREPTAARVLWCSLQINISPPAYLIRYYWHYLSSTVQYCPFFQSLQGPTLFLSVEKRKWSTRTLSKCPTMCQFNWC